MVGVDFIVVLQPIHQVGLWFNFSIILQKQNQIQYQNFMPSGYALQNKDSLPQWYYSTRKNMFVKKYHPASNTVVWYFIAILHSKIEYVSCSWKLPKNLHPLISESFSVLNLCLHLYDVEPILFFLRSQNLWFASVKFLRLLRGRYRPLPCSLSQNRTESLSLYVSITISRPMTELIIPKK